MISVCYWAQCFLVTQTNQFVRLCKHSASLVDNGCIKVWYIIPDMDRDTCLAQNTEWFSHLDTAFRSLLMSLKCAWKLKTMVRISDDVSCYKHIKTGNILSCFVHIVFFQQEKHAKICQKSATKRRKTFDSSRQRAEGTDIPVLKPIKPKVSLRPSKGMEIKHDISARNQFDYR